MFRRNNVPLNNKLKTKRFSDTEFLTLDRDLQPFTHKGHINKLLKLIKALLNRLNNLNYKCILA